MPEDRGRGDIRNDVYLFVISNEYENRPQPVRLSNKEPSQGCLVRRHI